MSENQEVRKVESDDSPSELDQAIDDLGEYFQNHVEIVGGYPSQIYGYKRIPGFTFIVHPEEDDEPSLEVLDDDKLVAHWRKLKAAVADGDYEDMIEAFGEEGWDKADFSD